VYFALDNVLRLIPNQKTFESLFCISWKSENFICVQTKELNVGTMNLGLSLLDGANLIQDEAGNIYFIDYQKGKKVKRLISSPEQIEKYQFSPTRATKFSNVNASAIPTGSAI